METDLDAVIERTARVWHEANRAYAVAIGEPPALVHPTLDRGTRDAPGLVK